jgi:hypothetical protein
MKNPDYAKVKHLIETGYIKDFPEFIKAFPTRGMIYKDIGMAWETFVRREKDPGTWTVEELSLLGANLGIEAAVLFTLADKSRKKDPKKI